MPTIFFTDAPSTHWLAANVPHVCAEYCNHGEDPRALFHGGPLDPRFLPRQGAAPHDWRAPGADNTLHGGRRRVIMAAMSVVHPTKGWIEQAVGEDGNVVAGNTWLGVYMFVHAAG